MQAPAHMCRKLAELHPRLRLAWAGRPPRDESEVDELNLGSFAVVQLFNVRDLGRLKDPKTTMETWYITTKMDEFRISWRERIDRGPVFGVDGRPRPDWDMRQWHPVFVATLDEQFEHPDGEPITTEDVFSGRFLDTIKYWLTPIFRRQLDTQEERIRNAERAVGDIAGAAVDRMWFEANKTGQSAPVVARKHHWEHTKRLIERRDQSFDDLLAHTPPPKGAPL